MRNKGDDSVKRIMLALSALLAGLALTAGAASAQGDAFTVSGVPIDATASSTAEAQQRAIAEGTPRALRRLFERLTLPEDSARLPSVAVSQATSLAIGFSVDGEVRGVNRYRGDLSVSFEPEGVRRILRNAGVPFVESAAPPTLVVPVYVVGQQATLWTANPWAEGWDESRYIGGFAPVVLPSGFGSQASVISAQALARGDLDALAALASAYGVNRVLLAAARPQGDTLMVDLTLVRTAEEFDLNTLGMEPDAEEESEAEGERFGRTVNLAEPESVPLGSVSVRAGESPQPFHLAADRAHEALANEWKQRTVIRSQSRTEMQITVLYNDISEWHSLRNALGSSPFITDVRLDAMARDGAWMALTYRGLREQLLADLQRRGVALRTDSRLGDVALDAERAAATPGLAPLSATSGRTVGPDSSLSSSSSAPASAITGGAMPEAAVTGPASTITPATPRQPDISAGMSADEILRRSAAPGDL